MKYAATATSVVGSEAQNHWSQTLILPHVFVVIEVKGENALQIGKAFLIQIQNQWSKFPRSLAAFSYFLNSCTQRRDLSYVALAYEDATLYVVVKNGGQVWIKRKEKIGKIVDDRGSVTGRIYEDDMLLLFSPGMIAEVEVKEISSLLKLGSLELISEALAVTLHKKDLPPVASAIVLHFSHTNESAIGLEHIERLQHLPRFPNLFSFFKMGLVKTIHRFKNIKPLGLVILVLIVVLLTSVGYGIIHQRETQKKGEISQNIDLATHKYEEAMALVDLNPIRARTLLSEARDLLSQPAYIANSSQDKRYKELLAQINKGIEFALRRYEVIPTSFFDLDLVKPQAKGKSLTLYQETLLLFDPENKSLYQLNVNSKASKIVSGGEVFEAVRLVTLHGNDMYVFDEEVNRVETNGKLTTVIRKDDEWGNVAGIAVFGGNLYLLDTLKNQIWKYIATSSGFSTKQTYLVFDTQLDLGNAKMMMIDGAIWIVRGNEVIKTVQGQDVPWRIQGLDEAFGTVIDLYTDDTTRNLYILDTSHKRVVVVDKDGVYLAQYYWQEDIEIDDFVVSEILQKILLLSNGTIYGIELK